MHPCIDVILGDGKQFGEHLARFWGMDDQWEWEARRVGGRTGDHRHVVSMPVKVLCDAPSRLTRASILDGTNVVDRGASRTEGDNDGSPVSLHGP